MNAKGTAAKSHGELVARILAGCWRTSTTSLNLSANDLDEVMPLLERSGAAALGWWRLRETQLRTTPAAELLQQIYRFQALKFAMWRAKIELAYQLLKEAKIDVILFKGWAAANFYPDRAVRPPGDIDLLVQPKDYEAAKAIFERPGARRCWVDLHRESIELDDRSLTALFARSHFENLGETQVRVLSDEDHLALLAIHLLKHGAWRPLWLCDIGAMIESLGPNFDWAICFGSNKRRATWIAATIALAHQLLGANIDKVPAETQMKDLPLWLVDSVLKQWGNLSSADHLPVQSRPLMAHSLRSLRALLKETRARWPDPIVATFNMRGQINHFPRLPYQLGAFAFAASQFVLSNLGGARTS